MEKNLNSELVYEAGRIGKGFMPLTGSNSP
jgi:hypothetical protein